MKTSPSTSPIATLATTAPHERRLRGETARDRDVRRYLYLVALPRRTEEERAEMVALNAALYG